MLLVVYVTPEAETALLNSLRMQIRGGISRPHGRAVQGMNCSGLLKNWRRGFESRSKHGCLCVYSVYVLSFVYVVTLRRADTPSKEFLHLYT
jgi:hypothetical protein